MTREEAIRKLQKQKAEYLDEWVDFSGVAEAFDMAIEALENPKCRINGTPFDECGWCEYFNCETCKCEARQSDLISRADVHKTLSLLATEGSADAKMLLMDAHEFIDALPSADAIDVHKAHEEEHLNIINRIKELQYAIAKTQTIVGKLVESADAVQGEWIIEDAHTEHCSVCGYAFHISALFAVGGNDEPNFCPNCGAKMKGGEDE